MGRGEALDWSAAALLGRQARRLRRWLWITTLLNLISSVCLCGALGIWVLQALTVRNPTEERWPGLVVIVTLLLRASLDTGQRYLHRELIRLHKARRRALREPEARR